MAKVRKLHIGGRVRSDGWEVFNIIPSAAVDHIGDARDLSRFSDNTFEVLYASHVLEHFDYRDDVVAVLGEWRRVLMPGGRLYVSVPNLETICLLWAHNKAAKFEDKLMLMQIVMGGHLDSHDYHQCGFFPELLSRCLDMAGFENSVMLDSLGLFEDDSTTVFAGHAISLNMCAYKPIKKGDAPMSGPAIKADPHAILHTILTLVKTGDDPAKPLEYAGLLGDVVAFYRKYWGVSLDWVYAAMLTRLRGTAEVLSVAAIDADSRSLPEAASIFAETAAAVSSDCHYLISLAGYIRKAGDVGRARNIICKLSEQQPGSQKILSELFMCEVAERFWSQDYYDVLAELHLERRPRVYLEIGVATGKSLALAQAGTRALGVDPVAAVADQLVYHSPANSPRLYKMTSDDFFATQNLCNEMGRDCFDLAFIDGLHHFDQVLRDFINLEQFAGPDSMILIHDCLPVDPLVATRERSTAFWTGDVWRIIPCLQSVRPDLEIVTLPVAPAGLAVVRRLNAASRVLANHYTGIVEQFEQMELPVDWVERCRLLAVEQAEPAFRLDRIMPTGGWS